MVTRTRKTQQRDHRGQITEITENSNAERKTETKDANACARKEKAPNNVGA
jgi:hypothetical protein